MLAYPEPKAFHAMNPRPRSPGRSSPARADMSSMLPPLRLEHRTPLAGKGRPQALEPPSGPSSTAPVQWPASYSIAPPDRLRYHADESPPPHGANRAEPAISRHDASALDRLRLAGTSYMTSVLPSPSSSSSPQYGSWQPVESSDASCRLPEAQGWPQRGISSSTSPLIGGGGGGGDDNVQTRKMRIRQQPEVARACGFGERDRRVVDPPPILELELSPEELELDEEENPDVPLPVYVVHASLWNEAGSEDVTMFVQPPKRTARRLVGTMVASGTIARDEHQRKGCFFTFADISCRLTGRYRLRFSLVKLDPSNMRPGISSPTLANLMSDVFTVFSPKDFPGMRRSTPLTQALKYQGVSVPAKKSKLTGPSRSQDREND